ncbi:hypothetical protein CK203_062264 [Vitis vinifera]|uniref:Uncharacterized protein n=1 Tax=Vitis vinifera TaxID=29760 RepID=A0A438FRD8_VITVI|nr:hypothetical protein CK203_062264 [Vitis vinifera]
MGVQTMGSQGGGGGGGGGSGNGKQSQFQPLAWKNSMYSLTLDELSYHESNQNVWTVEANNSVGMDAEGVGVVAEPSDKKIDGTVIGVDPNVRPQFPQQGQPMPQPLPMGPSSVMDVIYPDNQVPYLLH